jgi:hypothetical protein
MQPAGIFRPPLKYPSTTRECELIHRNKPKKVRMIFYARVNTQNRSNGRGRNSALLPHPLAHSPQIEHSGTAEKSGN